MEHHLRREFRTNILKFITKSESTRAGKKLLAYGMVSRRKSKKRAVSYQTTLCLETGHYKSRINWGHISRYSFKSSANKGYFHNLIKA